MIYFLLFTVYYLCQSEKERRQKRENKMNQNKEIHD